MSIIAKQHRITTPHRDGIALVVIAALFVAFSVVAAIVVERNTATQLINRREIAAEQLRRISNAIIEYGVENKVGDRLVYPCPASANLGATDLNFGKSIDTASGFAQNCSDTTGDVAGTPVTTIGGNLNVLGGVAGGAVIRGMVPVQALSRYGLGVNDAFDPWNNRIMYVVNRQLTPSGTGANTNNPTVTDPITSQVFLAPDFIIVSYGRDGVGATRRESTSVSIACTGTTQRRFENCDNDTEFRFIPFFTAATAGDATYFDDVLSFYRQ